MRVRRFFGFVLGGLSGRVPSEGSSDVHVRRFFGFVLGGNRFLQCNVMMQKYFCVFDAALLHKVDLVMLCKK